MGPVLSVYWSALVYGVFRFSGEHFRPILLPYLLQTLCLLDLPVGRWLLVGCPELASVLLWNHGLGVKQLLGFDLLLLELVVLNVRVRAITKRVPWKDLSDGVVLDFAQGLLHFVKAIGRLCRSLRALFGLFEFGKESGRLCRLGITATDSGSS